MMRSGQTFWGFLDVYQTYQSLGSFFRVNKIWDFLLMFFLPFLDWEILVGFDNSMIQPDHFWAITIFETSSMDIFDDTQWC